MKLNKRGIANIVVWLLLGLAVVSGIVISSTAKSFIGWRNTAKQNTSHVKKLEQIPLYDEKGKLVTLTRSFEADNIINEDRQPTFWQKYGIWILLLTGLAIAFPATTIKIFLKGRANIQQIATGIELAKKQMTSEQIKILETSLSKKSDLSTKAVIKKAKSKIKEDDLKV